MKLLMMGTGPFAVPTFRALYESEHEVLALVTRPPHGLHAGQRTQTDNPMRRLAEARGTPVFTPESINTDESRAMLAEWRADLFVVADYGQILAKETLAQARLGGINIHGSLLPKHRGAAPINWAIYHGETETGVTVIHMTPALDAGPCLAQARLPIEPDDTAETLEPRLAELGAGLVRATLADWEAAIARAIPQDPTQATRAPRLKKSDGALDFRRSAAALRQQFRALEPWPKTFTFWLRPQQPPLRVIIGGCLAHPVSSVAMPASASAAPGEILPVAALSSVESAEERLLIATGDGILEITHLQPAGKRMLPAKEFLHGYPVRPGHRFGPEPSSA